jgi:rhamnogalacturonan endolyase
LFESILNATKVQDETFETADGTYITKYDWSNYVRERDFNGVYGPSTGSWYIHPSTDYFSGNHMKQTLTVSQACLLDQLYIDWSRFTERAVPATLSS